MSRPLPAAVRALLIAFAALCVVMAVIGIIVPGMPTTVFVLMAGWAAARGSPRFDRWLHAHRLFGPMLRNWEDGGRVPRRAKWVATGTMAVSALVLCFTVRTPWVLVLACGSMAVVLGWLWFRPE